MLTPRPVAAAVTTLRGSQGIGIRHASVAAVSRQLGVRPRVRQGGCGRPAAGGRRCGCVIALSSEAPAWGRRIAGHLQRRSRFLDHARHRALRPARPRASGSPREHRLSPEAPGDCLRVTGAATRICRRLRSSLTSRGLVSWAQRSSAHRSPATHELGLRAGLRRLRLPLHRSPAGDHHPSPLSDANSPARRAQVPLVCP